MDALQFVNHKCMNQYVCCQIIMVQHFVMCHCQMYDTTVVFSRPDGRFTECGNELIIGLLSRSRMRPHYRTNLLLNVQLWSNYVDQMDAVFSCFLVFHNFSSQAILRSKGRHNISVWRALVLRFKGWE